MTATSPHLLSLGLELWVGLDSEPSLRSGTNWRLHCSPQLGRDMPWYGTVLRRWTDEANTDWFFRPTPSLRVPEFCVEYECGDGKRKGWELPKGGSRGEDSGPFATARRELWEETGVWLAWRPAGTYAWVSPKGVRLTEGPAPQENAWLVVDLLPCDTRNSHKPPPRWMTLEEFEDHSWRMDHRCLLRTVQHCTFDIDVLPPAFRAYWQSRTAG